MKSIILLAATVILAACSLTSESSTAVVEDSTETRVPLTPTIAASPTQEPSAIPENTANIGDTCTPGRAGWQAYSVQSGDTLAKIARQTNTSIDELFVVNCLTDANAIRIGQTLLVPQLPLETEFPIIDDRTIAEGTCFIEPVPGILPDVYHPDDPNQVIARLGGKARFVGIVADGTLIDLPGFPHDGIVESNQTSMGGCDMPGHPEPPLPTPIVDRPPQCLPAPDDNQYQVSISPSQTIDSTCLRLDPGTVTVTWFDAPTNFAESEFWTIDSTGNTNVIGVDQNPSDGASIIWTVHSTQLPVYVYAFGYAGSDSRDSGRVAVFVHQE